MVGLAMAAVLCGGVALSVAGRGGVPGPPPPNERSKARKVLDELDRLYCAVGRDRDRVDVAQIAQVIEIFEVRNRLAGPLVAAVEPHVGPGERGVAKRHSRPASPG